MPKTPKWRLTPGGRWSAKKLVHRHVPPRHSRFGVCNLPSPVESWLIGVAGTIDLDHIRAEQIDVPHHEGAGSEIVGTLLRQGGFCCWSVVVLASDLYGKDW